MKGLGFEELGQSPEVFLIGLFFKHMMLQSDHSSEKQFKGLGALRCQAFGLKVSGLGAKSGNVEMNSWLRKQQHQCTLRGDHRCNCGGLGRRP